jgi:putative SOS response-associated peptidase YedK
MCGRAYSTYTDEELEARYWSKRDAERVVKIRKNWNLCPTQIAPIVRKSESGQLELVEMRWGLIPSWAKDKKIGYHTINARSETVAEKPAFRSAFKKRRCLVPLSGFYEWKRDGDVKRPFAIHQKDGAILSAAGLWEEWQDQLTFTILTTHANALMEKIHDRMPVFLDSRGEKAWLDPKTEADALQKLLKPCPKGWLEANEVSKRVNTPKNNQADLLKPLTGEILTA